MSQPQPPQHHRPAAAGGRWSGVQRWVGGLGRGQRIGLIAGLTVVVALVGVIIAAVLSSGSTKGATHPSTSTSPTTTTPPPPPVKPRTCPLTGQLAPGGK